MFKNGFKAIIDPGGASYLTHYSVEESTPLYMHGNSFYLRLLAVKTVPTTTKVVTGIGEAEDWEHPEGKSEDETEEVPEAGITRQADREQNEPDTTIQNRGYEKQAEATWLCDSWQQGRSLEKTEKSRKGRV